MSARWLLPLLAVLMLAAFAPPASAQDPVRVSQTLEGCRLLTTTTLPNADDEFICNDAEYTSGNLGKNWNELDLVPYRLTFEAGDNAPATQTFEMAIALDYEDGGAPGYDFLSAPTLNEDLSDASCAITSSGEQYLSPGIGGIDTTVYRTIEVTMAAGDTCVFDYYGRLAVGSHLFPGSSLHANLLNDELTTAGVGARDVSIPVKEIQPQDLSKTMTASRGSEFVWNVTKESDTDVDFVNTCDPDSLEQEVSIRVEWTRTESLGDVTYITNVYASNPAHRTITVHVTDIVYDGTTPLDSETTGPDGVDVPAGEEVLVLTHTGTTSLEDPDLNDVATATYEDKATGIAVPGTTTATASADVVDTGAGSGSTADLTDLEEIDAPFEMSGDAFVTDPTGLGGWDSPYVEGTQTGDDIGWTAEDLSTSGSVEFTKTIYAPAESSASGTLFDTATLTPEGGAAQTATADIDITSGRLADLTIDKEIDTVLDEDVTFEFDVNDGIGTVETVTITIPAGDTTGSVTVEDLVPGEYSVEETDTGGFGPQDPQSVDLTTACTGSVSFLNQLGPATAQAVKVTDPVGSEAGWFMTLTNVDTGDTETVETGTDGVAAFTTTLEDGVSYTITETAQNGWDQVSATGDCAFTVDYPADADRVFECTITNRERGEVEVTKTLSGSEDLGSNVFAFKLLEGASTTSVGTEVDSGTVTGTDNVLTFGNLVPGAYQLCEVAQGPGWDSSLLDDPAWFRPNSENDPEGDNSLICIPITVDAGGTYSITVDNVPPPGGMARTIGFWKNHASCSTSGGNQEAVLDQFIGSGVLVGSTTFTTCQQLVRLLNKSTVDTGLKMAGNPAFNLAAQLVAATLNLRAGADGCGGDVQDLIDEANTLLAKYSFNGTGTKKSKVMTAADAALANRLAGDLDAYNNNELC